MSEQPASDFTAAATSFMQRFDAWILAQEEKVQLTSALAFGQEYQALQDAVVQAKE